MIFKYLKFFKYKIRAKSVSSVLSVCYFGNIDDTDKTD